MLDTCVTHAMIVAGPCRTFGPLVWLCASWRGSSELKPERIDDAARPRLASRRGRRLSRNVGSSGRLCLTTKGDRPRWSMRRSSENSTQLRFTRNHQVVKRFAANRADQALDVPVLPRRARRNWVIAYTHGTNVQGVRRPERAIAVTNTRPLALASPGSDVAALRFRREPSSGISVEQDRVIRGPRFLLRAFHALCPIRFS